MRDVQGNFHDFEGKKVWYRREGAGPPIIFLPNATLTAKLWDHQVEHFRDSRDVIAVDLPGFGRSDRLRSPSLEYNLRWLQSFIQDLDLVPVALVGNCIGSLTALHHAARHPGTVSALALINTLTRDVHRASLGRYADVPNHFATNHLWRWYIKHMPHRRQDDFIYVRGQLGCNETPHNLEYRDHARGWFGETTTRLAYFDLGHDIESWTLPRWTAVPGRPPLCWIWGDANRLLPLDAGRAQIDVLQPDEVHILEGVGYAAAWEAPAEVNGIIERFLDKRSASTEDPAKAPAVARAGRDSQAI